MGRRAALGLAGAAIEHRRRGGLFLEGVLTEYRSLAAGLLHKAASLQHYYHYLKSHAALHKPSAQGTNNKIVKKI